MPSLKTVMKVVNLLQKTPEIKKEIWYCQARKEEDCGCKPDELCQRAIATELKLSDTALKKMFDFFELFPEKSPFEIREIDGPKNKPRKFIKLKENYMEILFKGWAE